MFDVVTTPQFSKWLSKLKNPQALRIIAKRLVRLQEGYFGEYKILGDGINELKIDSGPGYRIYYTQDGDTVIVLLIGGDKSTQQQNIDKAKEILKVYQTEKDDENH